MRSCPLSSRARERAYVLIGFVALVVMLLLPRTFDARALRRPNDEREQPETQANGEPHNVVCHSNGDEKPHRS